jgi:hypothetical protein
MTVGSLTKGLKVMGLISMQAARRRSLEEAAMDLVPLDNSHRTGIKAPSIRTLY